MHTLNWLKCKPNGSGFLLTPLSFTVYTLTKRFIVACDKSGTSSLSLIRLIKGPGTSSFIFYQLQSTFLPFLFRSICSYELKSKQVNPGPNRVYMLRDITKYTFKFPTVYIKE